ncbi:MAG: aspartokinase [Oceanicoccus sp.]|jgi:aspartokinase
MRSVEVEKYGGENVTEMRENADRAQAHAQEGGDKILVLSAMRDEKFNTTSSLIAAACDIQNGEIQNAMTRVCAISEFTKAVIHRETSEDLYSELETVLFNTLAELSSVLSSATNITSDGSDYHTEDGISITRFGELISQRIYARYFELLGIQSQELNLSSYNDFETELADFQGGIGISGGHTHGLSQERGYSDLKAAAIAKTFDGLGLTTDLIVTKQFSLHSADPRQFNRTTHISSMRSDVAAVAFAANGVVQSNVMTMLKGTNVRIRVLNSNTGASTWVTPQTDTPSGSVQLIHCDYTDEGIHVQFIGPGVNGPVTRATTKILNELGIDDYYHEDHNNMVRLSSPYLSEATLQTLHDRLTQTR